MRAFAGLVVLIVAVYGCGPAVSSEELGSLRTDQAPVIVGTLNWSSTDTLPAGGYESYNAGKVGYLDIPARGARCTAWLASTDIVVTNNHCISTLSQAVGARVSFNFTDNTPPSARVWYDCSTLLKTSATHDVTALRCGRLNGLTPGEALSGWLRISTSEPTYGSVYIIQQNCDYLSNSGCIPTKRISRGSVLNANYSWNEASYDADTLGGSSGSPVFQNNHVAALHHVGLSSSSYSPGYGYANAGVRAYFLRDFLYELGVGWECNNGTCDPNETDASCPYDCGGCYYKCSDGVTCCGSDGSCPDGLACW